MLGVEDLARSKQFYGEGLGYTIARDYSQFVRINVGDGSSSQALYEWEAAAQDAGVSSEGSGFRGVSFLYIVPSREAVDEVMGTAEATGGSVVKAAAGQWGEYYGSFSDPDGLPLEGRARFVTRDLHAVPAQQDSSTQAGATLTARVACVELSS
jgi:uncharacterized protein